MAEVVTHTKATSLKPHSRISYGMDRPARLYHIFPTQTCASYVHMDIYIYTYFAIFSSFYSSQERKCARGVRADRVLFLRAASRTLPWRQVRWRSSRASSRSAIPRRRLIRDRCSRASTRVFRTRSTRATSVIATISTVCVYPNHNSIFTCRPHAHLRERDFPTTGPRRARTRSRSRLGLDRATLRRSFLFSSGQSTGRFIAVRRARRQKRPRENLRAFIFDSTQSSAAPFTRIPSCV